MTREEQIKKAAFDYGLDYPGGVKNDEIIVNECFIAGAQWADEHSYNRRSDVYVNFICDCGNVSLVRLPRYVDWKVVSSGKRCLETERWHKAEVKFSCLGCKKPVTMTLCVCEYPEGWISHQDVTADSGHVFEGYDITPLFFTDEIVSIPEE